MGIDFPRDFYAVSDTRILVNGGLVDCGRGSGRMGTCVGLHMKGDREPLTWQRWFPR